MILVIRIAGQVNIPKKIEEALFRLRVRRKYSAVILKETDENQKLLKHLRNYVAYGKISSETAEKIISLRGQPLNKEDKIDAKKIVSEIGKKSFEDLGLKPFFRLHPPRGGIESKNHFGVEKGVLGDNKDQINKLVERML